ncbi:50S ribosomal protein L25/general stress protein Ctc [Moraxella bovis]|uniref:50S ribosomal protein L25/general stress protein Ctc n=1 Tax=Moraxella bovis TaxID=476 RepID=UPI0022269D7C|nr:50S ribosomal protein L25/general stress protein Ctc [Moraxella bovis]UZA08037.1 50S ribosomal protein L25/general stress protein Ctc [Moraxella bovis]UZA35005.1 50S ribosomal protein L25/general stress protein Ctc [Moraxella bovis]
MSYTLTTVARAADEQGKGSSRRLRKANLIPAIVYGGDAKPLSVSVKLNELVKALQDESFFSSVTTLAIDGNDQEVIIKALQRHPSKGTPLHVDFQRVVRGQTMHFTVPVHFTGTAKGIKAGGILQTNVNELHINCLPRQLPEAIEVDVTDLEIGDLLRFSDIKLADGITIIELDSNATDRVVVSVQAPTVSADSETNEESTDAE